MGRTGYLAGSLAFSIQEIGAHGFFRNNTAGMFVATFVPVNNDDAILVSFSDSLIGTYPGTNRLGAMVAGRGDMTDKELRELTLFSIEYLHPLCRSGGYIMPVFAGY
jgi:hypothetical protein